MSRVVYKAKLIDTYHKLLEVYPDIEKVVTENGLGVKRGADDESGTEVKSRYYSLKNSITGCVDEIFLTNDFFAIESKLVRDYYIKEASLFKFISEDSLPKDQWEIFQQDVARQINDDSGYIRTSIKIDNLGQCFRIPKSNIGWY